LFPRQLLTREAHWLDGSKQKVEDGLFSNKMAVHVMPKMWVSDFVARDGRRIEGVDRKPEDEEAEI
jgi:hypothetical protein